MNQKRIFLTGYMASGKTTFGKVLSEKLGWDFIDLDEYIENSEGKKISEIFQIEGEEAFRLKERNSLSKLIEKENVLIATGGGTPCFYENMELMNAEGITVWLCAPQDSLVRRLEEDNSRRPLVAGKSTNEIAEIVETHLKARTPYYSKARLHLDSSRLENEREISETLEVFMKMLKSENLFV